MNTAGNRPWLALALSMVRGWSADDACRFAGISQRAPRAIRRHTPTTPQKKGKQ